MHARMLPCMQTHRMPCTAKNWCTPPITHRCCRAFLIPKSGVSVAQHLSVRLGLYVLHSGPRSDDLIEQSAVGGGAAVPSNWTRITAPGQISPFAAPSTTTTTTSVGMDGEVNILRSTGDERSGGPPASAMRSSSCTRTYRASPASNPKDSPLCRLGKRARLSFVVTFASALPPSMVDRGGGAIGPPARNQAE
jgi:hypothetical protein